MPARDTTPSCPIDRSFARREFLVGATGVAALFAALFAVRALGAQQQQPQTNFVPMTDDAYRPVLRPAKADATPTVTIAQRDSLEKQLKCQCPCTLDVFTCRTTDFSCGISPAMHRDVIRLVEGGYNLDEIKQAFVETYGEVVLTAPVKQGFNWVGYLAPAIVMATGGLILTMMLRRWSTRATALAAATPALPIVPGANTDDEMARLERALREEN